MNTASFSGACTPTASAPSFPYDYEVQCIRSLEGLSGCPYACGLPIFTYPQYNCFNRDITGDFAWSDNIRPGCVQCLPPCIDSKVPQLFKRDYSPLPEPSYTLSVQPSIQPSLEPSAIDYDYAQILNKRDYPQSSFEPTYTPSIPVSVYPTYEPYKAPELVKRDVYPTDDPTPQSSMYPTTYQPSVIPSVYPTPEPYMDLRR